MELIDLRISQHQRPFGYNVRVIERSDAIEQHSYWTQLSGHVPWSERNASVTGAFSSDFRPQHLKSPNSPPQARQRRSRSPEEPASSSTDLQRSQRLEDQQSYQSTRYQTPAIGDDQSTPSAPIHEAEPSFGGVAEGVRSIAETPIPEIPPSGTITVSLNRRPPLEVRTGVSIPRLNVIVRIIDSEPLEPVDADPMMGFGTLHAVVSLWSADGRVASPHAVPPMLTGRKDATLANVTSTIISERRAEATFSDLAITWPGHYRIRISIMETPLPRRDDDSDTSVGSPRQLLSIETRPIHAHGFAALELPIR